MKFVLVGDSLTGKTCFMVKYDTGVFPTTHYMPPIQQLSIDHRLKSGRTLSIDICDTPGQDDFKDLRILSYDETDVFLIFYSCVDRKSFENAHTLWIEDIGRIGDMCYVLVGNKTDLIIDHIALHGDGSVVSLEESIELELVQPPLKTFQISCLKDEGLTDMMKWLVETVYLLGPASEDEDKCTLL